MVCGNIFTVPPRMQNTALSFTERSGHCSVTSSDHSSWHPLATSEGYEVISFTYYPVVKLSTEFCMIFHCLEGAGVTVKQYICWCHSVDIILLMSLCWFPLWMSLCWCHSIYVNKLISLYWYHSDNVTLLISLSRCLFIYVTLLMSIC